MNIPYERSLLIDCKDDVAAKWFKTWKDSFEQSVEMLVNLGTTGHLKPADLEYGMSVMRLSEITGVSLKTDEMVKDIYLTAKALPKAVRWVTLGAAAEANYEGHVSPLEQLGNGLVVAAFDQHNDAADFSAKHPRHPAVVIKTFEDIFDTYSADEPLCFYYPSIPHKLRDERFVQTLKHFKNAILLCQSPSHFTLDEARALKKMLDSEGLAERFVVGLHSSLHTVKEGASEGG